MTFRYQLQYGVDGLNRLPTGRTAWIAIDGQVSVSSHTTSVGGRAVYMVSVSRYLLSVSVPDGEVYYQSISF